MKPTVAWIVIIYPLWGSSPYNVYLQVVSYGFWFSNKNTKQHTIEFCIKLFAIY